MIEQQPTVTEPTPPGTVVSLSDAAVAKLSELTKEETNPDIGLRVYVYSGGCSGFRYGMMLEDAPTPEDNVLDVSGIKVYVDGQSIALLQGSEIDYVDTLMGAGVTVNNPNAVAACGCGSSSFRPPPRGRGVPARTPPPLLDAPNAAGSPAAFRFEAFRSRASHAVSVRSSQRPSEGNPARLGQRWRSRSSRCIKSCARGSSCRSTSSRTATGR